MRLKISEGLVRNTALRHSLNGVYLVIFYFPGCRAPMPYIIGVHCSLMEEARRNEIGDAIVLNVDDGTIEDEHQDRLRLPSDCVSEMSIPLRSSLIHFACIRNTPPRLFTPLTVEGEYFQCRQNGSNWIYIPLCIF